RSRKSRSGGSGRDRAGRIRADWRLALRPGAGRPAGPGGRRRAGSGGTGPSAILLFARVVGAPGLLRRVLGLLDVVGILLEQPLQRREARVDHIVEVLRIVLHAEAALGAQTRAVRAAQGALAGAEAAQAPPHPARGHVAVAVDAGDDGPALPHDVEGLALRDLHGLPAGGAGGGGDGVLDGAAGTDAAGQVDRIETQPVLQR